MRRILTLVVFLTLAAWSCSSGGGAQPSQTGAPAAPDPLIDFTGVWRGTSVSSMNAARAKITFDLKREGNQFKGSYRCKPGNAVCRNNVDRGWVTGQVNARGFRVAMEDSSWCMYFMDEFYPPKADGEYTCYMNGGIADQGTFELTGPPAAPTDQGEAVGKPKP